MEKIVEKLGELKLQARNLLGCEVAFHVVMNGRLTSTAGRAYLESGKLEFSPSLYAANEKEFIADTVTHEFAHLVAFQLYGDKGHGEGWKYVMRVLGREPTRCHSYETPKKASSKKYKFACDCRIHEFTPQRVAWVRKGKVYRCSSCNSICKEVK